MKYEPHRFTDLFPPLPPDELRELTQDIKAHGQREPATVFAGKLLDGLSRSLACQKLGRALKTRAFRGSEADALAYVVSINVRRRHLSESQRAMVAARMAELSVGRPGRNAHPCAVTQEQAAKSLGVSRRIVQQAKYVQAHGAPSEVRQVERGELALRAVERALRERAGKVVDDSRERDARQLGQYRRRLVDTAQAFAEVARRVTRLAGELGLPLAEVLDTGARKVVTEAEQAAAGLLRA